MKIDIGYVTPEQEVQVITAQKVNHPIEGLPAVLNLEQVLSLQEAVKKIEVSEHVLKYIAALVTSTRSREDIKLGASARASIALMRGCCAWAMLEGRDYVVPDDVAFLLPSVLKHRIVLQPKAVIAGKNAAQAVRELLKATAVP
jgi:MoxR-like ATPase